MNARLLSTFGDIAVTPHDLSTGAAMDVLALGGSAVDAAIAANAVQGVVAPETCGVGGDLFALVWEPGADSPSALNASGPAGSNADAGELAGRCSVPYDHPLSVTVPGCVAGWSALLSRFGRLATGTVLRAAIDLAENGFPASTELADTLALHRTDLAAQPSGVDLYPDGAPPRPGRRLQRPLLASTLSDIVTDGSQSFYSGKPGRAISQAVSERITLDDLGSYSPEWVEPAHLDVFGSRGWTMPPNSQGYLSLATLAVFEMLEPGTERSPVWDHLLIESFRSVAAERAYVLADPRVSPHTWQELLSRERLRRRAEAISESSVGQWRAPDPAPAGTAFFCAVDRRGQAISLMQSNFSGIGSRLGAGTAGFFLHNRGAGFTLDPGHPNHLTPGRRPLHTLSPSMWTADGGLRMILGTRGGHQQPQLVAQMAANMLVAGDDPAGAQARPRWSMSDFGAGTASVIGIEPGHPATKHLRTLGHDVTEVETLQREWGPVSVIDVDPTGLRRGAADPRVDTASGGVR